MYNDLFCKLFINTEKPVEEVLDIIYLILKGEIQPIRAIKTKEAEFDLRINKEFDLEKSKREEDGFLYWMYYLDIEPTDCEESDYIKVVYNLIAELKKQGIASIAACDFEDKLDTNN